MNDAESGTASAKAAARLTFEPTTTPDAVIVKSFLGPRHFIPQPPFPRLHPTVDQDHASSYLKQKEEERRRQPPAMIAIPTPTTPWYPEKPTVPVLGKPLTPNLSTSLSSPRSYERAAARNEVVAEVTAKLGGQIPVNCRILFSCLCAEMNEKGSITAVQLTKVFKESADVLDISHVDSLFQLLDPRRRGSVHILLIMATLDVILNGPKKESVRRACFAPFNLDSRGYIHKAYLDALKKAGKDLPPTAASIPGMVAMLGMGASSAQGEGGDRPDSAAAFHGHSPMQRTSMTPSLSTSPQRSASGGARPGGADVSSSVVSDGSSGASTAVRTAEMVKVLNDVFVEIGKEEEEAYIASLSKGKKGGKKKAPPLKSNQKSVIPTNRARITHMDFATFDRYFQQSKVMSVAFARCWLPLVESDTDIRLHIVEKVQELADA